MKIKICESELKIKYRGENKIDCMSKKKTINGKEREYIADDDNTLQLVLLAPAWSGEAFQLAKEFEILADTNQSVFVE